MHKSINSILDYHQCPDRKTSLITCSMSHSKLPNEVLANIFRLSIKGGSSNVALVCRDWHGIALQNIQYLVLSKVDGSIPDAIHLSLRNNLTEVAFQIVNLTTSMEVSNKALMEVCLSIHHHAARADYLSGMALVVASASGHVEVVRALLDAPQHAARADCLNGRALLWASRKGHVDVVNALLNSPKHAARADCHDGRALMLAIRNGHLDVVNALLNAPQHAARADCQHGYALVQASMKGHLEIVRALIYAPQHAARANCQYDV
jgi:hypothetical protein